MPVFLRGYFGYLARIDVNCLFYNKKTHSQVVKTNRIYKTVLDEKQMI
jgi:hypothetical protein